jgi:hypothetical protein
MIDGCPAIRHLRHPGRSQEMIDWNLFIDILFHLILVLSSGLASWCTCSVFSIDFMIILITKKAL